jgi:hypothetical protein
MPIPILHTHITSDHTHADNPPPAAIPKANMKPRHGKGGRHPTRQSLDTLSGHDDPGMFGRMFPKLPALHVSEAALQALADAMLDANPDSTAGENLHIPAGFTYLGQFIDHDITLDLTSIAEKQEDPTAIQNFRTPRLDLDALYGLGPDGSPHLYARDPNTFEKTGVKFLMGRNQPVPDILNGNSTLLNDLPRSSQGLALIGDPRNDENIVVAQTHLAFLKFHNKVIDMLSVSEPTLTGGALFDKARRIVTWHYQWLVLHDFVERLTEPGIVAKILHEGRKFYRFKKIPYMPVEFSAAAYRLGHSMVRENYNYNRVFNAQGGIVVASLNLLFQFTGLSGQIVGELAGNPQGPLPAATVPSNWIIDWRRFFDFGTPASGQPHSPESFELNHSRKLDPMIIPQLHTLPGGGGNLALRNLQRGVMLGLPSGQSVAKAIGVKPLTPEQIAQGSDGQVAKAHNLHKETPLWYYILKEASLQKNGERMGAVGSRLIAEVFVGLVHGDHSSYLWQEKNWKPTLPAKVPGTFTMVDMLQFIGDISPIDGVTQVNTL